LVNLPEHRWKVVKLTTGSDARDVRFTNRADFFLRRAKSKHCQLAKPYMLKQIG
jgi:hypothetical protein